MRTTGTCPSVAAPWHGQQLEIYCFPIKWIQRCPCRVFFISSLLVGCHALLLGKALLPTPAAHLVPGLLRALPPSAFPLGTFSLSLGDVQPFPWGGLPSCWSQCMCVCVCVLVHHHGDEATGAAGRSLFQAHVKKGVVTGSFYLGKMIS